MQPNQKVTALKKEGKWREAWIYGKAELDKNPRDEYLRNALAWLCYEKLKQIQGQIDQRPEWERSPTERETADCNKLLAFVDDLGPAPPDNDFYGPLVGYHLREYGYHYENLIKLILKHGESFFAEDDFVPYQGEKYESPSQLVKVARLVAKSWLKYRREWGLEIDPVLELLEFAEQHAQDKNKVWVEYDHAKCLVVAGRLGEARQHALRVLSRKRTDGWAWAALAATYRKEDKDAAIACFCKALSIDQDPPFTIPQRKGLIVLFRENQDFDKASMLLKSLVAIYNDKGWRLKTDIEELLAMDWYDASVDEEGLAGYISSKVVEAEKLLYGDATTKFAIVDRIHGSGKGFNAFVSADQKYPVRKGVMTDKRLPSLGQWVRLSIAKASDGEEDIVAASPANEQQSEDVKRSAGVLRVNPKGFGFVDETFISNDLVNSAWDQQEVMVTQIWDNKPKTDEKSWRGIKLDLVDGDCFERINEE